MVESSWRVASRTTGAEQGSGWRIVSGSGTYDDIRDECRNEERNNDQQRSEDEGWPRDDVGHELVVTVAAGEALIEEGEIRGRLSVDRGGRPVVRNLLVEVDVEQGEDEAEHGRTEAVAEAANAGDHALDEPLLVRVRVHRDKRADGRVSNTERKTDQDVKRGVNPSVTLRPPQPVAP